MARAQRRAGHTEPRTRAGRRNGFWGLPVAVMPLAIAARADLPTTAPPTRAADDGNYIQLLQNYAYDIGIFAGLALALVVFFIVIKNTIVAYNDIPNGRSTMGAVAMQAGVGVLLMVFIMFLLTEAAEIL